MSNWTYQGKEILSIEDIPDKKAIGFIYIITQLSTGNRYIGRKMLQSSSKKSVKGKVKKIKVESNWLDYWSSSPKIQEWIKEAGGTSDFKREILTFCHSKSEMMYAEEYCLYITNALLKDEFINENIRAKVMRKWFYKNSGEFLNQINNLAVSLCK